MNEKEALLFDYKEGLLLEAICGMISLSLLSCSAKNLTTAIVPRKVSSLDGVFCCPGAIFIGKLHCTAYVYPETTVTQSIHYPAVIVK